MNERTPGRPGDPSGAGRGEPAGVVTLDCDTCAVRGLECGDCVVTVLLGMPAPVQVGPGQLRALGVLAGSGLVPPLRHDRVG